MRLPDERRLSALTSLGVRLDTGPDAFGELCDSTEALRAGDFALLRRRFAVDGYRRLRELLERERIEEAAAQVAQSLAMRRLLDPAFPSVERIAARGSRNSVSRPRIAAFPAFARWRSRAGCPHSTMASSMPGRARSITCGCG